MISFKSGREVASIRVGDHPQRMRAGVVRRSFIARAQRIRRAIEPKLTVDKATLDAALHCTDGIDDATRTPLMVVTGTGASGAEAYAIGKGALDRYGAPVLLRRLPQLTPRRTSRSPSSTWCTACG